MPQQPFCPLDSSIHQQLQHAKRVVVKLGSQIVIDAQGRITIDRLAAFVRQLAWLKEAGKEVVLVTSGAIATGRPLLGYAPSQELTRVQKQACAAVGQARLVNTYEQLFHHYGVQVAQVLLNPHDFSQRWRYQSAKQVLEALLAAGVLPILNENDALSDSALFEANMDVMALSFGDNDKLAALVSCQLEADVLLVLSNVEGIFTANPFEDATARRLPYIGDVHAFEGINTAGKSAAGRGGMSSKLESTAIAVQSGVNVMIASGLRHHAIQSLFEFEGVNEVFPATFVQAQSSLKHSSMKRWIGFASGYSGILTINEGAKTALLTQGASLLSVGVLAAVGEFAAGAVVSIQDAAHNEIARGMIACSGTELQAILGLTQSEVIARFGESWSHRPIVHRDKLMLFEESL